MGKRGQKIANGIKLVSDIIAVIILILALSLEFICNTLDISLPEEVDSASRIALIALIFLFLAVRGIASFWSTDDKKDQED